MLTTTQHMHTTHSHATKRYIIGHTREGNAHTETPARRAAPAQRSQTRQATHLALLFGTECLGAQTTPPFLYAQKSLSQMDLSLSAGVRAECQCPRFVNGERVYIGAGAYNYAYLHAVLRQCLVKVPTRETTQLANICTLKIT